MVQFPEQTAQATGEKKPNSYRWIILLLTAGSFLFTFIARFTWPPLIPIVGPALNMQMSQAGAYMSAFYLGYVITQIPAGILADRLGVRVILAASLIIEGLATFGMGYISTFDTGFTLRVITGLGAGAVYGACARALMEWFPARERGTAFGIMLAAPSGGIVLSNFIVPALNKAAGWQGAFKIVGISTVIVGVLVFLLMKTTEKTKSNDNILAGFKVIFGNKDLMLTAFAGFCLMWVELGAATWANAYMKNNLGFSVASAGLVMIFYGLGGVIAPLLSGYISDKTGNRKILLIVSYAIIVPLTVLFGYQTTFTMLAVVGFFFGFFSYLANPQLTVLISEFAGKEWAGTANGTSNFIFQIASMIGPIVLGWSIDFSGNFSSVWWIMAAGPLLGILLLLPVRPENKRA